MTRDELDDLILGHLDGSEADGARLERALAEDPEAGARLAELAFQEHLLGEIGEVERLPVRRPAARNVIVPLSLVAAAMAAALLVAVALKDGPAPGPAAAPVARPSRPPKVETPTVPAPRPVPAPRREEPKPLAAEPIPKPPPQPATELPRKPDPDPVVREPAPPEPPKPPASAPKTAEAIAFKPVTVAAVQGALWRRRDGKVQAVDAALEVARTDQLFTTPRRAASFTADAGCRVWLERGSTLSMEQKTDGTARLNLSGMAFFAVDPRTAPLVVAMPEGELSAAGASFQVERDEKRCLVSVTEGTVRVRNEKGEAQIKAGQRSAVRAAEKPSSGARADVEAATAWRLRPELAENPLRTPYVDREPGANRKLPGLVLAAPFFEGEAESGRLARATAEAMDAPLVLGHHFRDLEKKVWINVDRGMEADVRSDGTLAPEAFTERARKATADYLDQMRQAGGAPARQPVGMIVQFRNHYLTQGGGELEVCEVALSGWDRKTVAAAKAFAAQLLERHKPAYRVEMRFQGVDEAYEFKGTKRAFASTEADAKLEGYMAPRNARAAAAFFFSPGFGKRPEDYESYAKILSELIEFLYLRRR